MNTDFSDKKQDHHHLNRDLQKDPSMLEQIIFSSEKKHALPLNNFLNLSSKQSPTLTDGLSGSSVNKTKRFSKNNQHNWRQMLTPHQMNDITQNDYNTNQNITRPSPSPDNKFLGTDNSSKQEDQFQTHDFSEKINNLKTFQAEKEQLRESVISYRQILNSQKNIMSMNSNFQSMMAQTMNGNQLDFFQNLEKKYFMKAVKQGSSSRSSSKEDLLFSKNHITESQIIDQIEDYSQQNSVSSRDDHSSRIQDLTQNSKLVMTDTNDQNQGIQFNLQNYFQEFHEERMKQHIQDRQMNIQDQQEALLQAQIEQVSLGPEQESFNQAQSQMFSDYNMSPQLLLNRRKKTLNKDSMSPPLTSKIFQSTDNSREQSSQKKVDVNQVKLRTKHIVNGRNLSIDLNKVQAVQQIENQIQAQFSLKTFDNAQHQFIDSKISQVQNEEDILQTYRNNCEMARHLVKSTYIIQSNRSGNSQDTQNFIVMSKQSDSSKNCTPDVYQTAKFNNLAPSIESFQNTMNFDQFQNLRPQKSILESQITMSDQNKTERKQLESSSNSQQYSQLNTNNLYLFEENVALKSYLQQAYGCVVQFLNSNDPSNINPQLIEQLQIFAELEQNKKEWLAPNFLQYPLQESKQFQSERIQYDIKDEMYRTNRFQTTPQQQEFQNQNQEISQNETPCSSIQTNLSGIKQNLKETKKSLLQAKKLLFQEKCINIDHEKQIQDLHQKVSDIQSHLQQISQSAVVQNHQPFSQYQSPDDKKQYNFLQALQSPFSQQGTTQCTKCCSTLTKQPYSPIAMATFSNNTQNALQYVKQKPRDSNYDSFITENIDEAYQSQMDKIKLPQIDEYSFLKDEAEQLLSQSKIQKRNYTSIKSRNDERKNNEQLSLSVKDAQKMHDVHQQVIKLRSQVEDNIKTFSKVQQELNQKDFLIQEANQKLKSQKEQIAHLKSQIKDSNQSLQSLIETQKQQEDFMLDQIQKFNQNEEEFRITKKHYQDCRQQLEYFKQKYESFCSKDQISNVNSSRNTNNHIFSDQKHQNLFSPEILSKDNQSYFKTFSHEQNQSAKTKDSENKKYETISVSQNQKQSSDKQTSFQALSTTVNMASLFNNSAKTAAGTIHHQKKNTANFNSPSEFFAETKDIQNAQLILKNDKNAASLRPPHYSLDDQINYQSESLRMVQDMRQKVNQKFGRISLLLNDDSEQNQSNHCKDFLRNSLYQNTTEQDQLTVVNLQSQLDGVSSQFKILSPTDLDFLNSINVNNRAEILNKIPSSSQSMDANFGSDQHQQQQKNLQNQFKRFNGLKRKHPTMIVQDVEKENSNYEQMDSQVVSLQNSHRFYDQNNSATQYMQNSSILKYSGDTFV
eukprot:403371432